MKMLKVILVLTVLILVLNQCMQQKASASAAVYVGSDKCQSCHQKEAALFQTSDHYHAMDTVSAATVKGNFNNTRFIYTGDTAFFYQREGKYFVRTTDSTGTKKEFMISYTFGWQPLQQYLVKFDDGRMQVLPFCWDTRPKEKGGQRWFHLYNKERISHTDELFWMGMNQNWNYMCADCHTTDFKKNFQLSTNSFNSTWNESRVSCESCHGPASVHLQWAETKDKSVLYKGFSISLASKLMNWKMDATKQTRIPETAISNDTLIETCARCHARATRFTDEYVHGQSFLQSHIPATASTENYYVDGQIKDEDYEYASFLQSKMHAAGVTCINCHDPHSMKIKATGNALCGSCHSPAKYDGPQHSFHQQASTGNQCVNCHMPVTTYMVVDNRLDHSIRIPRPDQSLLMGTPNACNKCHTDKTVAWAANSFSKWYAAKLPKEKTYAELMYNLSRFMPESESSLYTLLQSATYPAIIKATAMEQYGYYSSPRIKDLLETQLSSSNTLLRLNAVKAMLNYPEDIVLAAVPALLFDAVKGIRMEAMTVLAPFSNKLEEKDSKQFQTVLKEYLQVQEQMSHRPEGFYNRAIVLKTTGNATEAEQLYLTCIQRFPAFAQSYSNLVDLYREQGRDAEAKQIADKGLQRMPDNPFLHYALGLWYIRQKDNAKGMDELKTAATLGASNAQMVYGYAIGLFSMGEQPKAVALMEQFVAKYGNQALMLDGLISVCQDMKLNEKAANYTAIRRSIYGY